MNKPIRVGVLASLLLAPTMIANAQEIQPQEVSQVTSYTNAVAVDDTQRAAIIKQYGALTEKSTADAMVIAKRDLALLSTAGFNDEEISFITAKYNYIEAQKAQLVKLKEIGTAINALSYTSKTFTTDVPKVENDYEAFLTSYDTVQFDFQGAVDDATQDISEAKSIVNAVTGTSLQYGYNETARKTYFKSNGADIAKLEKFIVDADAVKTTINMLDALIDVLGATNSSAADIINAAAAVTVEYTPLTTDQKKIIVAYNPKDAQVTPYKQYTNVTASQLSSEKVKTSLNNFLNKQPTDFKAASNFISEVKGIESAYTKLSVESQRLLATEYGQFTPYKAAAAVSEQITKLRPSNRDDYRTAAAAVKELYDALTKKEYVKNYTDLERAIANIDAATVIEQEIKAINGATDKISAVQKAREAYTTPKPKLDGQTIDAATVKKIVNNLPELTNAEKQYKAVLNVITLVSKLEPTAKDYVNKAKAASAAYNKLDATQQGYVKTYDTNKLENKIIAMDMVARIEALNSSKADYSETVAKIKTDYDALSLEVKALVTNYSKVTASTNAMTTAKNFDERVIALANESDATFVAKLAALSAEYKEFDNSIKKLVKEYKTLQTYEKNNANVIKVINLITALNPTNKDYAKKVLAARQAYNALDIVSQKRVTNYENLVAVEDVATLIALIEALKPTSKSFINDLNTARKMYNALPEPKKQGIINYEKLVQAEAELNTAQKVMELIDLAVPDSEDYLTKLMNARVAYDKLDSGQKKLVANLKDLTEREKLVKPILTVMVQIDNLDPSSSQFLSKVNAALKSYDKLSKEQKKYVHNMATLQSYEPLAKVIELIGKLKPSSPTFQSDTTHARSMYNALSTELKPYVSNYNLLQAAEASILGAGNVQQMIEDLPSVEPKQYVKRIAEIRAAYNALPRDQQMAVSNYKTLQEQEKLVKPVISIVGEIEKLMTSKNMDSQYQKILKAYDNLDATQRKYVYNDQLLLSLDNVIKVYKSIASLKPSDKLYFGMIESVRRDYDSLNSVDKQRVSNYSILLEAEKQMSDVKKMVGIISSLRPTSSTYLEDVANALAAYKALDSKVRGQVLNYDVLKQAEKDVASVLKVVQAIGEIDPNASTYERKVVAAQKLYSALTLDQQGLVYNYRILQEHINELGLE
ncbi:hypothetical protein [Lysinibacillus piscis]|uniref:Cell wall-binding protein n=1 Tax=Lysinibacillus piscis TaxID=2518931 RepID=A0ABQ5NHN6_9BACI|nr:hypothetical protein LYSBPC_09910 [Lysinibacillus sp. KH24]